MPNISIDLWMDFGCPWSRISLAELDRVLPEIGQPVTVNLHSLRLDPDSPADYGRTTIENLCEHLSIEPAQAEEMLRVVVEAGARAGLKFDFHRARGGNSLDAHRLTRLAAQSHSHLDVARALFAAHFEEGLLISDHDVLSSIASNAELARNEVERLLASDEFTRDVLEDEATALKDGIEQSPHFVINGDIVRNGVQYADDWREIMRQVIDSAK